MSRPVVRSIFVAGITVLTAACGSIGSDPGAGTPISLISMDARTKGAAYTTYPLANFYHAQAASFTDATQASDTCQQAAYSATINTTQTSAQVVGGGAYVALLVSGHADTLRRVSTPDGTYELSSLAGFVYNPGDTITFTIPGDAAGFPAAVAAVRTAEPFSLSPIVIPPASQSMTITWSAALDNNAAMIVSLRYNDGTAGAGLNQQIFCDFHDDGAGTVQAALAAKWAASTQRDVFAERLRSLLVQLPTSSPAYVNITSTYARCRRRRLP